MRQVFPFLVVRGKQQARSLPVPRFIDDQERLRWIQEQVDQVIVQAVEEFRQRLGEAKQQAEKRAASQQLDQEG